MILLSGCAGGLMSGAGCDSYRAERISMPDVTASGAFLRWFNALDARMAKVCNG